MYQISMCMDADIVGIIIGNAPDRNACNWHKQISKSRCILDENVEMQENLNPFMISNWKVCMIIIRMPIKEVENVRLCLNGYENHYR